MHISSSYVIQAKVQIPAAYSSSLIFELKYSIKVAVLIDTPKSPDIKIDELVTKVIDLIGAWDFQTCKLNIYSVDKTDLEIR